MALGRPKKEIDIECLRTAVEIQCSWEEIEALTGASRKTLEKHYSQVIAEARCHGRKSLRKKQYDIAIAGNVQMLIWLGKQYLDQKDRSQVELTDEQLAKAAEERLRLSDRAAIESASK